LNVQLARTAAGPSYKSAKASGFLWDAPVTGVKALLNENAGHRI